MKARALLAAAVLMWAAQAGAADAFAGCPSGLPRADVGGRALPVAFWERGPVLVVFWSVDCAYCHRHNERLARLVTETPGARVLGVVVDSAPEAVRDEVERHRLSFPVIVDGRGDCALRPQLTPRRLVPMSCWLGEAPGPLRCIPGEMGEEDLRELLQLQLRSSRHS